MNDKDQSAAVRLLNDSFRKSFQGGSVVLTVGIVALGAEAQEHIFEGIRAFEDFSADNDPWDEHDFGSLEAGGTGERIFFKIDYYDLTRSMHSEDPADPMKTERVMTIMLASEY